MGTHCEWSPSSYIKKGNCASVKKKKESGLVQQPVIQFQDCLDQANSDKGVDFSHFLKTGMALLTSRYEYLQFQKLLQVCESHGSFRAQLRMNPVLLYGCNDHSEAETRNLMLEGLAAALERQRDREAPVTRATSTAQKSKAAPRRGWQARGDMPTITKHNEPRLVQPA
jgi:hypothetical protein